ncbi:MAG: TIGR02530 family flagellar biosynthesis protein [bacterium]
MVAKSYGPGFNQVPKVTQPEVRKPLPSKPAPGQKTEFQRILEERSAAGGIEFSAHAVRRLEQRSIAMSPDDVTRLAGAVDKAASKGARESLVLLNDNAMIVSVANRKVITVMALEAMKENVITNIDSAVIA